MKTWLHSFLAVLTAFAWLPLATAQETFPIAPAAAVSNATVTVNNLAASRHGEYWHRAVGVDNDADAAYAAIKTVAVRNDYGEDDEDIVDETTGHAFVPQNPEGLFYDHDGNVGADGRWAYSWDGENRLIGMEAWEDLPTGARRKLAFSYDWQGRRTGKVVWTWNTSTNGYEQVSGERFVYDGWNLVATLSSGLSLQTSFLWGSDLSGSMDGAGGVGGLLTFTSHLGSLTSHFAAYDGNGNVTALVDTSGATTATYEYSPFGGLLRCEGEAALANPFRFSSKFTDDETGLLYYGYRFYSPTLGRWISRDPIEEEGGLNIYGFVGNNSISQFDHLGMFSQDDEYDLDMRLEIAAHGSAFVATYAYDTDTMMRHMEIMANAQEDIEEFAKVAAVELGMTVGGGMAGRMVMKGLAPVGRALHRMVTASRARHAFRAFDTFDEFKAAMGRAGDDMDWHPLWSRVAQMRLASVVVCFTIHGI